MLSSLSVEKMLIVTCLTVHKFVAQSPKGPSSSLSELRTCVLGRKNKNIRFIRLPPHILHDWCFLPFQLDWHITDQSVNEKIDTICYHNWDKDFVKSCCFFLSWKTPPRRTRRCWPWTPCRPWPPRMLHSRKTAQRTIGTARRNAQEEGEHWIWDDSLKNRQT